MPAYSHNDPSDSASLVDKSVHLRKMHVRIHEHALLARLASFYLKEERVAITIGSRIYLHNTSAAAFLANHTWVAHELAHVRQFSTYGLFRFLWMYLWESCRNGYYNNKWEVAARKQEADLTILDNYTFV